MFGVRACAPIKIHRPKGYDVPKFNQAFNKFVIAWSDYDSIVSGQTVLDEASPESNMIIDLLDACKNVWDKFKLLKAQLLAHPLEDNQAAASVLGVGQLHDRILRVLEGKKDEADLERPVLSDLIAIAEELRAFVQKLIDSNRASLGTFYESPDINAFHALIQKTEEAKVVRTSQKFAGVCALLAHQAREYRDEYEGTANNRSRDGSEGKNALTLIEAASELASKFSARAELISAPGLLRLTATIGAFTRLDAMEMRIVLLTRFSLKPGTYEHAKVDGLQQLLAAARDLFREAQAEHVKLGSDHAHWIDLRPFAQAINDVKLELASNDEGPAIQISFSVAKRTTRFVRVLDV